MEDTGNLFNSEEISKNRRESAALYLELAQKAEEIVKTSYEAENSESIPSFPIDIELVAKHFGIEVKLSSLNLLGTQFSHILAVLLRQNDQINILVDDKVGYKTRRYAIANAIARFLLKNQSSVFSSSYAIPLIPQSLEEISADVIALFMLMPLNLFKEEFVEYIENVSDRPMDVDRWMDYLSDRTQISSFNLAIGYQQMKMVLCYEHQQNLKKAKEEEQEEIADRYATIFA